MVQSLGHIMVGFALTTNTMLIQTKQEKTLLGFLCFLRLLTNVVSNCSFHNYSISLVFITNISQKCSKPIIFIIIFLRFFNGQQKRRCSQPRCFMLAHCFLSLLSLITCCISIFICIQKDLEPLLQEVQLSVSYVLIR